jgi:Protein of unknown function (DUF1275)
VDHASVGWQNPLPRLNARPGNHGGDHPLAEHMIPKANSDWLLPALLSTTAGAVDVIGFLALGVFTAHITGNLVILAAHYITGGFGEIGPILSVPVFMLVLTVVTLAFVKVPARVARRAFARSASSADRGVPRFWYWR